MEKLAIVCMIFVIGLLSCEKQDDIKNVTKLETAKTTFKRAEPAEFTFKSDAPPSQVKWSVTPEKNVTITADGYTARVLFSDPGRYQVIATDNRTTSRTFVDVDTAAYSPGDTATIPPQPEPPVVTPVDTAKVVIIDTVGTHNVYLSLDDEEFTLTPILLDSLTNSGLAVRFDGKKTYPCLYTNLAHSGFRYNAESDTYQLTFYSMIQPGARYCEPGAIKAMGATHIFPLKHGRSNLEIKLGNNTYSGYITREGDTYNITWPYSTGIKFSKLVVTK
ncbi:MAG TPA: hypothetical protein VGN64_11525 [Dyadobacter sp.]|jgi:hypothetical protein|nr:hypothetical protein [Dyadobacter sp.]